MTLRNNHNNDLSCQEKLQHLGNLALEVVEALLTDTETSIDTRLSTAFRIVEMCARDSNKEVGQTIINGIEQNARQIEKNANELAILEALLKMGTTIDHDAIAKKADDVKNRKNSGFFD
jgi:hypothetical protein